MRNWNITYTIEDDIEALYFTLIYIACDGIVTWRKCENLQVTAAVKLHTVVKPSHQFTYVHKELREFLEIFHDIVFPQSLISSRFDWCRRKIDIDTVICAFENYLTKL